MDISTQERLEILEELIVETAQKVADIERRLKREIVKNDVLKLMRVYDLHKQGQLQTDLTHAREELEAFQTFRDKLSAQVGSAE